MCNIIKIMQLTLTIMLIILVIYLFYYNINNYSYNCNNAEYFDINNELRKNKRFIKNNDIPSSMQISNLHNSTSVVPVAVATNKQGLYSQSALFLDDPLFADVGLYNNDINPYVAGEESGLEKCLYDCNGNCVEFGVTGITFCFPQ